MRAQVKKLFDRYVLLPPLNQIHDSDCITQRLKKECKTAECKFQGSTKTVKMDEVFEKEEFDALFKDSGHGTLVQPTPDNKPNSTVTIINFVSRLFSPS